MSIMSEPLNIFISYVTFYSPTHEGFTAHTSAKADYDEDPGDFDQFCAEVFRKVMASNPAEYGWRVTPTRLTDQDFETGECMVKYRCRAWWSKKQAAEGEIPQLQVTESVKW